MRYLVASIAVCLYTGAQAQPAAPATLGPQAPFSAGEPVSVGAMHDQLNGLRTAINEDRDVLAELVDLVLTQQAELEVLRTATPGVQGVTCRESEVGTFEIGCRGGECGNDNAAWVVLPTGSPPGDHRRIRLARNIVFDAMPAQPFATTPGLAWDRARPFYLYAVLSPDFAGVGFALSPNPTRSESPGADHVTWRGHVNRPADDDVFFMLEADQPWANRPVWLLGRVGMVKDAQDNWTLADRVPGAAATMKPQDCIGPVDDGESWSFPPGQMGAEAGRDYLSALNGSPPTWRNAGTFDYRLDRQGMVTVAYGTETANSVVDRNGTDGAAMRLHLPYRIGRSGLNEWFVLGSATFEEPPGSAFPRTLLGVRGGADNSRRADLFLYTGLDSGLVHLEADWFNSAPNDSELSINFAYRAF